MSKNKFSLFQITITSSSSTSFLTSHQHSLRNLLFFQTQGSTDNYSTFGCPDFLILEMAISTCTTIVIERKKVG